MEKRVPHYKLSLVKNKLAERKVRPTLSAQRTAKALGVAIEEMVTITNALRPSDFYKSMTTYNDHTIWQDVYRPLTRVGYVYLKLTVLDDVLIVSFKEL